MAKTYKFDGETYEVLERGSAMPGSFVVVTKINRAYVDPVLRKVVERSLLLKLDKPIAFEKNGVAEAEFDLYLDKTDADIYEVVRPVAGQPPHDAIVQPSHYTQGGVEVIDIIAQTVAGYDDPFVGHCVGTATKYLNRAPYKHDDSGLEDLRKARKYLDFAIGHITKGDE